MKQISLKSDGIAFTLVERDWEEFHGITAAIITLNEEGVIEDFLKHIKPLVTRIVLIDGGSCDRTVELAEKHVDTLSIIPFRGHFAEQKNNAMRFVRTDWTIFLDPDERFSDKVYKNINNMINQNEFDCYKFPRREFIDGVEDKSIYPDYQARLFRSYCRFVRPIHEELVGYQNVKMVEENSDLDILHSKIKVRHNSRNEAYPIFGTHYIHEWGTPGKQTKDTLEKPYDILKEIEKRKGHQT